MAYNGVPQQQPQLTAEEIAYWASQGYYYDPAYSVPAVAPAPAPVPLHYDYSSQQYPYTQSIPPSRPGYPPTSGIVPPAHRNQPLANHTTEYEDLNKLFADPKKAQQDAAAAAAEAEAEAKAAKDKAAATVVRSAAGQTWQDPTLLEFEE
ncbi:hypothetical protein BG004_000209, partial [Podila humilis]